MIKRLKAKIAPKVPYFLTKSLRLALKQQNLDELSKTLCKIKPDISKQYTNLTLDSEYLDVKVRNMHAFQTSLIQPVLEQFTAPVIVDIGDSSGTHINYLQKLYPDKKDMRCLSVNLDQHAVKKIQDQGLEAICARAEGLEKYNTKADIFLCFETLEHLMDPCNFLYALSSQTPAKYFILTVPFVRQSRIGLHQIRRQQNKEFRAENAHIFELSPKDWKLLFKLAGWKVEYEDVYLQYPKYYHCGLKYIWRKFDFEGFWGARLVPDPTWKKRYMDWPAEDSKEKHNSPESIKC